MKKKKRKVFSKKEKIIMISLGILAFILILGIILMPTKIKNVNNQVANNEDLNRELTTVQDVVEYLESTFISMEESKTDGYDLDIYVNFKYDLYEGNISKEQYFKNFYEKIAVVTKFKSFRIIDSSKDITIEVKCSSTGISEVKINGETDYFKKQDSKRSQANALKFETKDFDINSEELKRLIDNNWNAKNVQLGTAESKFYKYDVYFDEGYEIRTIQGKVFNIVFNKRYNKKVIEDYKPGDDIKKIEAALGDTYEKAGMIEYKTKDYYVIFSADEISIYPNRTFDYTDFETLLEEYNENQDINDFIYELTDIWPDYDIYEYSNNSVKLGYTLKGVMINFTSTDSKGIQLYENYKGELKTKQEEYKNTYYALNENLMMETEKERRFVHELTGQLGSADESLQNSDNFKLMSKYEDGKYKNIKIYSINKDYPNNEFDDSVAINSYVWADNDNLIYSITNDGIYIYNAKTRKTEKIIEGTQTFEITDYNRNTNVLEYDEKSVKISF